MPSLCRGMFLEILSSPKGRQYGCASFCALPEYLLRSVVDRVSCERGQWVLSLVNEIA